MEEAPGNSGSIPAPAAAASASRSRAVIASAPNSSTPRRLSPRQVQQQILVNLLRNLKDSFEAANDILEQILVARSTYNDLYSKRHTFWKNLLCLAKQLGAFNCKASAKRRANPKMRRTGFARGRKILKGVTKLWKPFDSLSTKLHTAHQRFEDISQRFWDSQNLLDAVHGGLETMTPEEMSAAQMPDFLWVKNNLYPDHVYLKRDWESLELNKGLKKLRSEFRTLKGTDFKKEEKESDGETTSGSEVSDVEFD